MFRENSGKHNKPYITGDCFGELRDTDYFRAVRILPGGTGILLPQVNLAPHELYELGLDVGTASRGI
jgi:hypothetical protein